MILKATIVREGRDWSAYVNGVCVGHGTREECERAALRMLELEANGE